MLLKQEALLLHEFDRVSRVLIEITARVQQLQVRPIIRSDVGKRHDMIDVIYLHLLTANGTTPALELQQALNI